MDGEAHLGEELLNMYLDGELSAEEQTLVEEHLASCGVCQADLASLQQLFAALEEVAPAPDLVPAVLARIKTQPGSLLRWLGPPVRRRWVLLTLQLAAVLVLLVGIVYGLLAVNLLSGETLHDAWVDFSGWMARQWAVLRAWTAGLWINLRPWPATVWAELKRWAIQGSVSGDVALSLSQLVFLGTMLVVLWLLSNVLLLRRARLNGPRFQRRY